MYSNYQNEDGEWLMDGAAIRAEWAADEYAAYERDLDNYDNDYYTPDYYGDTDACVAAGVHGDDTDGHDDGTWTCSWCGGPTPTPTWDDGPDQAEDAHLDGMWEE